MHAIFGESPTFSKKQLVATYLMRLLFKHKNWHVPWSLLFLQQKM